MRVWGLVAALIALSLSACGPADAPKTPSVPLAGATNAPAETEIASSPTPDRGAMLAAEPVFLPARVVRVIDGTTIEVAVKDRTISVRLAGLEPWSGPRSEGTSAPAAARLAALLAEGEVYLEVDPNSPRTSGPVVCHAWVGSLLVSAELVREGQARVEDGGRPDRFRGLLRQLEAAARVGGKGLWAGSAPGSPRPEVATPVPTPAATVPPTTVPTVPPNPTATFIPPIATVAATPTEPVADPTATSSATPAPTPEPTATVPPAATATTIVAATATATATPIPTPPATGEVTFVLNTSTLKFHHPTCRNLPTKNRLDVDWTREQVIAAGYTPCGICKP